MKIYLTALFLLGYISALGQFKKAIAVSGKLPAEAGKTITITGKNHFEVSQITGNTGQFHLNLEAARGYYQLHAGAKSYFIYLKPGFDFAISLKDSSLYFTPTNTVVSRKTNKPISQLANGSGAEENNVLRQMNELATRYFGKSLPSIPQSMYMTEPADFINTLNGYQARAVQILNSGKFDTFFKQTQADCLDYLVRNLKFSYRYNYGRDMALETAAFAILKRPEGQPITLDMQRRFNPAMDSVYTKRLPEEIKVKLMKDYWGSSNLDKGDIYGYCIAYDMYVDRLMIKLRNEKYGVDPTLKSKPSSEVLYDIAKKEVKDDLVQQALLYKYISLILKNGKDVSQYAADYDLVATDQLLKNNIKRMGLKAPDFIYEDNNGNKLTLSSLKGSYIYIDVWATWCGPCIGQLPSLQIVEKKYEGKNIKFVSLSIDKSADKEKWRKYVADKKLAGIQVIADKEWRSEFALALDINSIPRFVLIDPDGKIVEADADRPSNPNLQIKLDKLLTKQ